MLTSATKKVDVAVFKTIEAAKAGGAEFTTNFNAIFTVKNGGVGYGKISTRAQPSWKKAVESIRQADRQPARSRSPRRRRPASHG